MGDQLGEMVRLASGEELLQIFVAATHRLHAADQDSSVARLRAADQSLSDLVEAEILRRMNACQ